MESSAGKKPGKIKSGRLAETVIVLFFIAYFVVGLLLVPDFGMSTDDLVQRRHSLVNYKYVNKVLFNREIPALKKQENLEDYDQYYGVAMQLPIMIYSDLRGFSLTTREIYLSTHYICFLWCFTGYIFFYLTLRKIFFRSKIVPVLGTMMISLYPRFFDSQSVDVKNLMFAAACMIAFFFMVMAVEKKKARWQILFGCSAALAANTRVMGIVFPVLLIAYYLCADITEAVRRRKAAENGMPAAQKQSRLLPGYFLVILSFSLFWFIITPKAWAEGNPFHTFLATFSRFSNYDRWSGKMVFMGKLITCSKLPWYYLFVWLGISIPLLYLALFVWGHIAELKDFLTGKNRWYGLLTTHKWFVCSFAFFHGSIWAVILLKSKIYVGWHHLYFIFVPMCIMICFGLEHLLRSRKLRPFVIGLVAANLIFLGGWLVKYHPWGTAYFNVIGNSVAEQYDRGETHPASYQLCRWILDQEPGPFTLRWAKTTHQILTEEEKSRVKDQSKDPDYIISYYRGVIGNDLTYDGYEEVHTVWVNRYKVGSVFKRIPAEASGTDPD